MATAAPAPPPAPPLAEDSISICPDYGRPFALMRRAIRAIFSVLLAFVLKVVAVTADDPMDDPG